MRDTSRPTGRPPLRRGLLGSVLALALAAGTTACSDDGSGDGPGAAPPAQSTDDGTSFRIETVTTLGRVVGRVPAQQRERVPEAVSDVVQRWFDRAYLGGDYPRSDFGDVFPGFTTRAEAEARRDRALMSNATIGDRVEEVTPTRSRVRVDLLAVRRHVVAATARFRLSFQTEGDVSRKDVVDGRLRLVRKDGRWRIFAYDVSRGA